MSFLPPVHDVVLVLVLVLERRDPVSNEGIGVEGCLRGAGALAVFMGLRPE
ncbi:MAG: hypothetical protein JKY65_00360 [Planctomycetes bacterium]|nr:hypothetical protein [Planctomycetota bacterium]